MGKEGLMNNHKIEIYIAAHNKSEIPSIEGYKIIEVGSFFHPDPIYAIRDNSGNNISEKNKTFCELTAYYWMWKNSRADYIGLVHYRRFFSRKRVDDSERYYLQVMEATKILENYDVILPEPIIWWRYTIATGYDHGAGFFKDLMVVRNIISQKYPAYLKEWDQVTGGHKASYCNVMVTSKKYFDSYCEWLFDILFEAESQIDISNYTSVEKRIFGFLSEILLNVWVQHNQLRVYYMPLVRRGQQMRKTLRLLKVIEKIPGSDFIVRNGLTLDFNRGQRR